MKWLLASVTVTAVLTTGLSVSSLTPARTSAVLATTPPWPASATQSVLNTATAALTMMTSVAGGLLTTSLTLTSRHSPSSSWLWTPTMWAPWFSWTWAAPPTMEIPRLIRLQLLQQFPKNTGLLSKPPVLLCGPQRGDAACVRCPGRSVW